MSERIDHLKARAEFEGSLILDGVSRPVMSRPSMPKAAKKMVDEVRLMLDDAGSTEEVADWIAAKMERYAAYYARPVFDMHGNGPQCSLCSMIWPLCGHHHYASGMEGQDDDEDDE